MWQIFFYQICKVCFVFESANNSIDSIINNKLNTLVLTSEHDRNTTTSVISKENLKVETAGRTLLSQDKQTA